MPCDAIQCRINFLWQCCSVYNRPSKKFRPSHCGGWGWVLGVGPIGWTNTNSKVWHKALARHLYDTSLLKENLYIDRCGRVPKQWSGRKRIAQKITKYLAVDAISFHQQYSFENASNVPMQLLLVSKRTYDRFSLEPTMRDITERLCCRCLQHLKTHRKQL